METIGFDRGFADGKKKCVLAASQPWGRTFTHQVTIY